MPPNVAMNETNSILELSGVKTFELAEGEKVPDKVYEDPSVHTVIINRKVSDGSVTQTILKRRQGSTKVRNFLNPNDFCQYQTETAIWDYSSRRDFKNHDIEPIVWSDCVSIPTCEIDVSTKQAIEDTEFSLNALLQRDVYQDIS